MPSRRRPTRTPAPRQPRRLLTTKDYEQAVLDFHHGLLAEARRKLAKEFSGGVSMPAPVPNAFGITEPADAAWLKAKCRPHPLQTYETRLTLKNPIGNGLAVTYVAVKPDYGPTAAVRAYVKTRKDWNYVELQAAHDAMVDQPQAVIDIISGL